MFRLTVIRVNASGGNETRTYSRLNRRETHGARARLEAPSDENGEVTNNRKLRSDTQRTRDRMLDVMGRLLEEKGLDFSLPDLARESGVATATVYRHFDDLADLRQEFYDRFVSVIVRGLTELPGRYHGHALLHATCQTWVDLVLPYARAATLIRSAEGYLERARAGDSFVSLLHRDVLVPILDQLIESSVLPDQDRDRAALIWITLFDERVLIDLSTSFGWDATHVAASLETALLGALRATVAAELEEPAPTG